MKKLIAYSSVAHMGFVTIGIFSSNIQGLHGAIMQMISHGLISAALFFCIGSIYNRYKTKEISFYGGLGHKMSKFSVFFSYFHFRSHWISWHVWFCRGIFNFNFSL